MHLAATRTYCAFTAGSGITPILGILKSVLETEPNSRFLLFYGNRTRASILFAEELLALKDRYLKRLALYFLLSRESQDVELFNGRLDGQKISQLARELLVPNEVDTYLLCGPGDMSPRAHTALTQLGVDRERIHMERFATNVSITPEAAPAADFAIAPMKTIQVSVVMDGRRRSFSMPDDDMTLLEAAEEAGIDLPYSCRAGVCATCRTRLVRGQVAMRANYALEPWETEAGYVLCCQSVPTSTDIELNYDER